jgi:hypothetical protein
MPSPEEKNEMTTTPPRVINEVPRPGYRPWYPSKAVSDYYGWFVHMGYPQLDIVDYTDGSWAILEYHNAPIIPSLTKFHLVLTGIRNIEKSYTFCKHHADLLDPTKRNFQAHHDAKTKAVELEHEALERHRNDSVERAFQAISKNQGLIDRISRDGIMEMNLDRIRRNIPGYREPWKERPWLM